jgi:hypothetical protein
MFFCGTLWAGKLFPAATSPWPASRDAGEGDGFCADEFGVAPGDSCAKEIGGRAGGVATTVD